MTAGASTLPETVNAPGKFVIVLDGEWTPDEMLGLGKLMGTYGKDTIGRPMTGHFVSGSLAEVLYKYNELRQRLGDDCAGGVSE